MTQLITPLPARHPAPTARASSLTHLIFERPDLELAERYLVDFGLVVTKRTDETLYLRGTSSAPYCYRVHKADKPRFLGLGFTVESRSELERLAQLPGASEILQTRHPGDGLELVLHDPAGFVVEILQNQTPVDALPHRQALPVNSADEWQRINDTQRPPPRAPEVVRLGHCVLEVADYQASSAWYTQHLGLIPSDIQVMPDGSPAVTFFRLDLGDTPADHHTLALAQSFMAAYSHSAYELIDADAIGMGQRVLRENGWKHAWGIGRHILGSQIFDYWQDPWGDKHEHYCDGDVFTADRPVEIHRVSRAAMSQWGQPMPSSFTKPKLTPSTIAVLVRNVRNIPDLTVRKLVTLAKLFG